VRWRRVVGDVERKGGLCPFLTEGRRANRLDVASVVWRARAASMSREKDTMRGSGVAPEG
jgi:hypothetical protein